LDSRLRGPLFAFRGNKKPLLIEEKRPKATALFSSFPGNIRNRGLFQAGFGTCRDETLSSPVAVVSTGQSLNHS